MLQIFLFTSELQQSLIPSQKTTRFCWEKNVKTWLVDDPMHLQGKLLWTRLLFGIRQAGASLLPELMPASFLPSLYVKQCQLVCTRDGSQIRNLANLNSVKRRRGLLQHGQVILSASQTTVESG